MQQEEYKRLWQAPLGNGYVTRTNKCLEPLPEAASLLLDVIRFTLALLVLVGHTTLPFFSLAWPPMLFYADLAVPGFFVLSGFMIRYVTSDRESDARRYFISRASRLYSVLLPALVLSLLCGAYVSHVTPGYWQIFSRSRSGPEHAAHAVAHLLFLTQYWGHAVLFPPNLPLWSLGYEVPYYILFGLLVLCSRQAKWLYAAAYAAIVGPQVLFLLPLWWSGCWLYDLWQWLRCARKTHTVWMCLLSVLLLLWIACPLGGVTGWSHIAAIPNPLQRIGIPPVRAQMGAYASGLAAWSLMLLSLLATDRFDLEKNAAFAQPIRRLAEGTFTLYVFHFPLLCLIISLRHGNVLRKGWQTLLVDVVIVVVSVCAAIPIDHLKSFLRSRLRAALV